MRIHWLGDIHLNFLTADDFIVFIDLFMKHESDAMVITGDIAEGDCFDSYLALMAEAYKKPIYYVLGNHDYYRSSFRKVKDKATALDKAAKYNNLFWLNNNGIIKLTDDTCLVGHDGWYDARFGDYWALGFDMSDFKLIEDIASKGIHERFALFNNLGDECAEHIRQFIYKAFETYDKVIFATHVPPFAESAKYRDQASSATSLPFFTNKAAGEAILDVMEGLPENKKLTVLSSHTHFQSYLKVSDAVSVYVSEAHYGYPKVYTTLEV